MSSITGCCLDCKDRYPACHDSCEKYLQARESWEIRKEKIKNYLDTEYDNYKAKRISQELRRRNHGK